jgi:hypothetical protein
MRTPAQAMSPRKALKISMSSMGRDCIASRGLLAIARWWLLLALCGTCFGQSGILSASRYPYDNWHNAGLPGTITFGTGGSPTACNGVTANCTETVTNPWTPPTRVQCGSTVAAGTSVATINTDIAACSPGSYVLLGSGAFTIGSNIVLRTNGVSLRGSGPMSTTLNFTGTANIQFGVCCGTSFGNLTATSYSAGTTSVTLSGGTGVPAVNQVVELQQCNTAISGSGLNGNGDVNCTTATPVTFTNGSAVISAANSFTANTVLQFLSTGTLPTNFATNTVYFVISTGLSSSQFEVSASQGGSAITAGSAGSGTQSMVYDPGSIEVCGIDYPYCSNDNPHSGADNFQHQTVRVTGVAGSVVTFTPGLYMPNWSSNNTAVMIWQSTSNTSYGVGAEDLTANFTFNTTEKFDDESCYACWIKGNRIIGDGTNIRISLGGHVGQNLISNNYVFGENPNNLASGISEPFTRSDDTGTLVLNNIFEGGICVWGDESEVAEVIAYNFCRDVQTPYSSLQTYLNHNPTEAFTDFEGNEGINPHADSTHGTNNLVTDFRNYAQGWDNPYHAGAGATWAIEQDSYQRFYNYIGNALGGAESTIYKSAATNVGAIVVTPADALTAAGYMLWGNCDVVNAGCRFQSSEVPNSTNMPAGTYPNATTFQNATPANNNLPCSFFLQGAAFTTSPCSILNGGTNLSWWKNCKTWSSFPSGCTSTQTQPFPPVGPDQSGGPYVNGHAYDNPAAIADINLPVDTSLQTAFTITASSWSNSTTTCALNGSPTSLTTAPCEILTVSLASINNGSAQHIMGRFQFGAGINAACKTGATSSGNNGANDEIYIVNSTTTQIAYSLGSSSPDNGSSNQCTGGTFKFPDVRQFDEVAAFQLDSGGASTGSSLTGVTATGLTVH